MVKCDKLVSVLGLDKDWSTYYYCSRELLTNKSADLFCEHQAEGNEFDYYIPEDVVAIKSLKISKLNSEDQAAKIYFEYDLSHCTGYMHSDLSTSDFWTESGSTIEDKWNVFVLKYEYSNYDSVKDFKFKTVNQVLKNSIRGGHNIKIHILDSKER